MTLAPATAFAAEGGQSPYLKGARDFLTGLQPPPGIVLRNDLYFYSGAEKSTVPQGQLTANARSVTDLIAATVTTPYLLMGGHYGFAARAAVTSRDSNKTVTRRARFNTTAGDLTSYNDVVLTPLIIGWHQGRLHWNVSLSIWLPVGDYDKNRMVNTGKNYWALSPQLGVTYLDPTSGWEISAAAIYVENFKNTATQYQSGNLVHVDFAVGKYISPAVKLGVVGYYVQQLNGDSGAGALAGARKERVAGIGPALSISFPVNERPVTLTAKYYREFSAQNTMQGDAGTLSASIRF